MDVLVFGKPKLAAVIVSHVTPENHKSSANVPNNMQYTVPGYAEVQWLTVNGLVALVGFTCCLICPDVENIDTKLYRAETYNSHTITVVLNHLKPNISTAPYPYFKFYKYIVAVESK